MAALIFFAVAFQSSPKEALDRAEVTLDLREFTPQQAFDDLAAQTGVTIRLDQHVRVGEGSFDRLTLEKVPGTAALAVLCDYFEVMPVFEDAGILVSAVGYRLGVFDVSDIAYPIRDAPRREVDGRFREASSGDDGEEVEFTAGNIVELIQTSIDPEIWEGEGVSIDSHGNLLFVRAPLEARWRIQQFLDDLRDARPRPLTVELRAYRVEGGRAPAAGDVLDEATVRTIDETAVRLASRRSASVSGQRVDLTERTARALTVDLRRPAIGTSDPFEFARSLARRLDGDALEPVRERRTDGLFCDVRAMLSHDGRQVFAELRMTLARMNEPGAAGDVERISGRIERLHTNLTIALGAWTVASTSAAADAATTVVLLRVTAGVNPPAVRPPAPSDEPSDPRIDATHGKLDTARLKTSLKGPTLTQALEAIGADAGVRILLSRRLEEFADGTMRFPERGVSCATALKAACDAYGLDAGVREGFVLVGPPPDSLGAYKRGFPVRVYPVSDVIWWVRPFTAPRQDVTESGTLVKFDATGESMGDFLTGLIPRSTGGDSWETSENAHITVVNNDLVIAQSDAVHREIVELLDRLRAGRAGNGIRIAARVVEGDAARTIASASLSCLNASQAYALLSDVEEHVAAYRAVGNHSVPDLAPSHEGWIFQVNPNLDAKAGVVRLTVDFDLLERSSLKEVETPAGTIQSAEFAQSAVRATVTAPLGEEVVAGTLRSDGGRARVLLLRASAGDDQ